MSRASVFAEEDLTTTFPSSLADLTLGADNLVDEDLGEVSNLMDASFEFSDSQPRAEPAPHTQAESHAYLGSMASSSAPLPTAPAPESDPKEWTPVGLREEDDEELQGATEEEGRRYAHLREERDALRGMNAMLGQIAHEFTAAEGQMERMDGTIATTHALLDLYSRLSSQAEHTQQLVFSPQWEGATKDFQMIAQREAEEQRRLQEEEERRAREEAERRAAEARAQLKAEEDARKRAALESKKAPVRGSVRGRGLPPSSLRGSATTTSRVPRASTANGAFGSASAPASAAAAGSGIGRGGPPVRGTVTGVRGVRGLRPRGISRGASSTAGGAGK